jgi:general secretion pathway protein G
MAASNASSLATQVQGFIVDHGKLESGASIDILWQRPSEVAEEDWEPYVGKAEDLLDPWGNKFVLRVPGEVNYDFDIISYGADGQPGGEGEDADIIKP